MAHYASANWNPYSGKVATLLATTAAMRETTGSSSTEATDKLTYTVPVAGLYRCTAYIKVTEVSDAATSHVLKPQVAWNDGSSQSAADMVEPGVTAGTVNGATLNEAKCYTATVYAAAASSITITILNTVTGSKTAGAGETTNVFEIEAL
jgi:hypothetical protein